jgi:hypothetical protein
MRISAKTFTTQKRILDLKLDTSRKVLTEPVDVRLSFPCVVHPHFTLVAPKTDPFLTLDLFTKKLKECDTLALYRSIWNGLADQRDVLEVSVAPTEVKFVQLDRSQKSSPEVKTIGVDWSLTKLIGSPSERILENDALELVSSLSEPHPSVGFGVSGMLEHLIQPLPFDTKLHWRALVVFATRRIKADLLATLLARCNGVDPHRATEHTFDAAFPNLTKLGDHYRSLKLSDLEAILEAESQRSKGDVELFGAKISSELFVLLGLPSLFVLLLQFASLSIYIAQNVVSISIDEASQWSLLLNDIGSIAFGLGAIFILPVFATVMNVLFATTTTWYRWLLWGPLATIVIAASTLSAISIHRLRCRVGIEGSTARLIIP